MAEPSAFLLTRHRHMRAWVGKLNCPIQAEIVCEPARTSGDLPEYNVVECRMKREIHQRDVGDELYELSEISAKFVAKSETG